jgi:hypothetical protein
MFTAVAALACVAHLPSYGCVNKCCHPPHVHTESQVFYGKGNWGLELDISDFEDGEMLDVDAVFRDPVDPSSYSLYIGCGGCVENDPILAPKVEIKSYEPAVLEPFTSTRYYSVFPKEQRKYNTSLLLQSCTSKHFTIRLVDYGRSDGSTIVWAPVIGLSERETLAPLSLIQYPVFVLNNHGYAWNEQAWSYWVMLFVVAPVLIFCVWSFLKCCCCFELDVSLTPQNISYGLAILGFTAALLENFYHTVYAQHGIAVGEELSTAISVNVYSNGLGIIFCVVAWKNSSRVSMGHAGTTSACATTAAAAAGSKATGVSVCWWWCSRNQRWAVVECVVAFFFLFLFGAGFYIGPAGIFFASVFRGRKEGLLCLPCCGYAYGKGSWINRNCESTVKAEHLPVVLVVRACM